MNELIAGILERTARRLRDGSIDESATVMVVDPIAYCAPGTRVFRVEFTVSQKMFEEICTRYDPRIA